MADSRDELITAIADGVVAKIAASCQADGHNGFNSGALNGGLECVGGVMTVLIFDETGLAEIIIITGSAVHELGVREFLNTAVACADAVVGSRNGDDPLGMLDLRSDVVDSRLRARNLCGER